MRIHRVKFAALFVSIFLLFLLLPGLLTVSAYETREEMIERMEDVLKVSVFYEEDTFRLIQSFDVNSDGWYAIAFRHNTVMVYDSLGEFQYGFSFKTDGAYGIELREHNVLLYRARSDAVVEIDSTGKCVDAKAKSRYTDDMFQNAYHRRSKQVGDANYCVERDIGLVDGDYPRLVRIDESGNKTILYDSTTWGYFIGVFHYMVLAFFLFAIVFNIIKISKKNEQAEAQSNDSNNNQTDN